MKLYTEDDGEARGWLPGGQLHTDLLVLLRVYLGWRYRARLQLTLPVSLLPPAQLGNQRVQVSRTGVLRASLLPQSPVRSRSVSGVIRDSCPHHPPATGRVLLMFLTPYKRHAVSVLAAVTLLSGCGLTQRVTDGTKEVASAIFYKQIKTLHLDFVSRSALNTDAQDTPLSTMIHVWQLKTRERFDEANYDTLLMQEEKR